MSQYVVGMEHLYDRLQMLATVDQRKLVRAQMREAIKMVYVETLKTTPVDTGNLLLGLKIRAIRRSRRGIGYRVRTERNQEPRYYGGFVNYGTKYMAPRRFMNRAADAAAKPAMDFVVQAIEEELRALGR